MYSTKKVGYKMQNTNNFDNFELRQLKNPTHPTLFSQ